MEFIDITKSNSKDVYTFSNVAKGCYSIIDYICVWDSLNPFVIKYDVVHSPYNFSDHEPVEIVLSGPIVYGEPNNSDSKDNYSRPKCTQNNDGRFRITVI